MKVQKKTIREPFNFIRRLEYPRIKNIDRYVDRNSLVCDYTGNVTFSIPSNVASDKFAITPGGLVTLRGPLNREQTSRYSVPILARSSKLLDISTLEVLVMDENDNSPEFRPGSCYTLAVPENQPTSVIHTIAATDLDEGKNGEIYYSIVGKSINPKKKKFDIFRSTF